MTAMRSLSLTRNSEAPVTTVSPSATAAAANKHRKLIDSARDQLARHGDAAQ